MSKIEKTLAEWQSQLTPEQFAVCRQHGTERAFTGLYTDCKTAGNYLCVCCSAELFDSSTKYNSGSGWPSFWDAAVVENIATRAVTRIWGTCSPTGRRPPGSATASIPWR